MAATARVTVDALRIAADPDALQELQNACEEAMSNMRGPGGTPAPVAVRLEDPEGGEITLYIRVVDPRTGG